MSSSVMRSSERIIGLLISSMLGGVSGLHVRSNFSACDATASALKSIRGYSCMYRSAARRIMPGGAFICRQMAAALFHLPCSGVFGVGENPKTSAISSQWMSRARCGGPAAIL